MGRSVRRPIRRIKRKPRAETFTGWAPGGSGRKSTVGVVGRWGDVFRPAPVPKPNPSVFTTERVAPEGRGGRFRMKRTPGGHLLRFWAPSGPRRRGTGRLVSILHPNPGCLCPSHRARRRRNPPERVEDGHLELIGHEEETRYTRRPGESKFAGRYYHKERDTRRRQYAVPDDAVLVTEAGETPVGGSILTTNRRTRTA